MLPLDSGDKGVRKRHNFINRVLILLTKMIGFLFDQHPPFQLCVYSYLDEGYRQVEEQVIGRDSLVSSCIREGLDEISGKNFFTRKVVRLWSVTRNTRRKIQQYQ